MSRRRQPEGGEGNEDGELEAEEAMLGKLKRQYRMMERNRHQYHDEAMVVLTRQR